MLSLQISSINTVRFNHLNFSIINTESGLVVSILPELILPHLPFLSNTCYLLITEQYSSPSQLIGNPLASPRKRCASPLPSPGATVMPLFGTEVLHCRQVSIFNHGPSSFSRCIVRGRSAAAGTGSFDRTVKQPRSLPVCLLEVGFVEDGTGEVGLD